MKKLLRKFGLGGFFLFFFGLMFLVVSLGMCSAWVDGARCGRVEALISFPNFVIEFAFGIVGLVAGLIIGFLVQKLKKSKAEIIK